MAGKHIVEILTETNKKISDIIDNIQNKSSDKNVWINDLNSIIRQLDHAVEELEKNT